jgi:hypothetical protein
MGNDTRNDWELPCYMDVGSKLFPEAPDGQGLDLTTPNRDTQFNQAQIVEGQKKGMRPVKVWLLSHRDALSNNTGPAAGVASDIPGESDFYGDGGGAAPSMAARPGEVANGNIYNEMPTKVYVGPYTVLAEYQPQQASHVLLDFGIEKDYKDAFFFLIRDALKVLGRVPQVGDVVERFDGKLMEIMTSVEAEPVNWEYLYQFCTATNTNKDSRALFRS